MMLSSNALSVIVAAVASGKWQGGKVAEWQQKWAAICATRAAGNASRLEVNYERRQRWKTAVKIVKKKSFPFLFGFFFCCCTGHTLRASGGQKLRLLQLTTPLCYYVSRIQDSDPFRVRVGHQPSRAEEHTQFALSAGRVSPARVAPDNPQGSRQHLQQS